VQSVEWIDITEVLARQWLDKYVTVDKMFYKLLLKQEIAAVLVTSNFFFYIAFLQEAFIKKYNNDRMH